MEKRILVVAIPFPPDGTVGSSIRVSKLNKYLSRDQWEVFGLTTSWVIQSDANRLEPYAEVFRISHLGQKWMQSIPPLTTSISMDSSHRSDGRLAIRSRCLHFLRNLTLPDRFVFWVPEAVRTGIRMVRKFRIPYVLSVSPSPSCHLVGLGIKYFTRVIWAADFKDQWVDNPILPGRPNLSRDVELSMQARVVEKADVVTATTEHILADLNDKHPRHGYKMKLLPNGYDEEDFYPFPPRIREGGKPLVMVHVGSFYMKRSPENLFSALSKLRSLYPDLASRLRLRLIGYDGGVDLEGLTGRHGLDGIILPQNEVDHEKSLQAMADADVLLLVPGANYAIPGKLYEYMAAGRPLVALAHSGSATSNMIEAARVGSVINPGDNSALFELLKKLIQAQDSSEAERILGYEPQWPVIRQFSRESTAKELARSLILMADTF